MKWLKQLFSGRLDTVTDLVDDLTLTKEEKQQFKLKLQSQLMQQQQIIEESYQTALTSRADIIKAELTQGDPFTKRARPMIIYAGLLFIAIVYVIVPVIYVIKNGQIPGAGADMFLIKLPEQFWWAWGTVVGVYGAGRSAEKLGTANRLTQFITGSNASKATHLAKG
ncbi:MAG: hypothetical protein JXQ90_03720 [Cyclobacteriaceae bacterium]